MARREVRYWDSCCFIRLLADEPGADQCHDVLRAAMQRQVFIVTSTLTIAEVLKLKKHPPIGASDKIRKFFEHEFIVLRTLDRRAAEFARELHWAHKIDPKDAVHVATALIHGCARLDTTDDGLKRRSGLTVNDLPSLRICGPTWDAPQQITIHDAIDELDNSGVDSGD